MKQEKYCPKCGYKNDLDSLFCIACGNKLSSLHTNIEWENIEKEQGIAPIEDISKKNCICPVCGKDDKIQKVSSVIAQYDSQFKSNSKASGTLNSTTSSHGFSTPFLSNGQIYYNTSISNTEGVIAYNSSESGVQTNQLVKMLKQLPSVIYQEPPRPVRPEKAVSEAIQRDILDLHPDIDSQIYTELKFHLINLCKNKYLIIGVILLGTSFFILGIIDGIDIAGSFVIACFFVLTLVFLFSIFYIPLFIVFLSIKHAKKRQDIYNSRQLIKERKKDEYDQIYKTQQEMCKNYSDNLTELRKKSREKEKYIKNKFKKTYYCYRDDVIFEPGFNDFGRLSNLESIRDYYLKNYQDD